jgi:diguanylate cyclase
LYIDIDHFKKVNDSYGHASGDLVLKDIGKILKHATRGHDIVSRKGGEEFAALLVDCSLEQALNAAERIRRTVEAYDFKSKDQTSIRVTISIGISSISEKTRTMKDLIEHADSALYSAKNSGRNQVVVA